MLFFFQAEDGIRDLIVTGFRRVLFRSRRRDARRPGKDPLERLATPLCLTRDASSSTPTISVCRRASTAGVWKPTRRGGGLRSPSWGTHPAGPTPLTGRRTPGLPPPPPPGSASACTCNTPPAAPP